MYSNSVPCTYVFRPDAVASIDKNANKFDSNVKGYYYFMKDNLIIFHKVIIPS